MIDTNESKIEAAINTEKEEELAVTNVKVNLYPNSKTRLKGKISITLNNCFVVHGIKVIDGEKGIFIAMPSIKNSKGIYVDIAHPINKETRQKIESSVIEAFQEVNENQEQVVEKDIF
ncbi:SpoVG family protein [Candidatus Phytoplasma luffae]|nr:SpoVG family protein [Candidatus Phytoplasma luffae]